MRDVLDNRRTAAAVWGHPYEGSPSDKGNLCFTCTYIIIRPITGDKWYCLNSRNEYTKATRKKGPLTVMSHFSKYPP